ncbi:MAG: 2-C-methyl-D-erythritol 4-phosphate cytidylyltransferase [Methylophilaceae bacterium]|jgi:2-C-methyl-D-erythritol 4-phosphate cytidylyltransferase|nr:2-C-methyl-D-erythritol 4-phosphate cytidylyltransferase [Methyloradius sp.]
MPKFHVIIPAAGAGSRMGSQVPKQYLSLSGRPMIEQTLRVFSSSNRISSVAVVLSVDDLEWDAANIEISDKTRIYRCGGITRSQTVLNGLGELSGHIEPDDWVLVHDAARPGLTDALLNRLLDTLENDAVGGLLAIPLADTLKRADDEQRVAHTEPRDHLWQAQTPQMFPYGMLVEALKLAAEKSSVATDEAQAIEALGHHPKLVPGELRNLKVTYPEDLALIEAILQADATQLASKTK